VKVDFSSLDSIRTLIDQEKAIVAPQLTNRDGSKQASARGLPFLVDKIGHRGLRLPGADLTQYVPDVHGCRYVAWNMGAAICASRMQFAELGGWDARYFIYYEDHDLGLRAWRAGIPVVTTDLVRWEHAWARETMSWKLRPWLHELASARRFYTTYPEFLLPTRKWAAARHKEYCAAAGRVVPAG
jgi:N-acetylglucosaminyl-diphospho-decaprenol L-rhamnosyltransferase